MTHRPRPRLIVFAIGTLGVVPAAVLESLRLLALEGITISLTTLQVIADIGSV